MTKHSSIVDSGAYFQIIPHTRKIVVPPPYAVIGTVGEHFAEQLTFRCPKLIDGHDVAKCANKYVTWQNVNGEVGHDKLKNVLENGKDVYFTWDVRNGLTVAKGIVSFSVHFEDVDANGKTHYRWSTTVCKECEILDSINASLGKYEAVYVEGDVLVFADYNIVKNSTLPLDTNHE